MDEQSNKQQGMLYRSDQWTLEDDLGIAAAGDQVARMALEEESDREILLANLAILHRQPWSPEAFVGAILEDWPEDEPTRLYTLETAEQRLLPICERILAEQAK